jgi:hypothetical protein
MLTPAAVADIRRHIRNPVSSQVFASRETSIPGLFRFHSLTGISTQDPSGFPKKTNAAHGWPDSMVIEHGAHPCHPDARTSCFGTPPPRTGSVRGRCGHSRLACSNLVSSCTPSRRSYGPPRGSHLAPGPSHGNSPLLRAVRVDGKTPRLPLQAPRVFYYRGFTAGVTRFGPSPDGYSAAYLLASELAASTSQSYR